MPLANHRETPDFDPLGPSTSPKAGKAIWHFCIRKRGLFEYRTLFQETPLAVPDFIMPLFQFEQIWRLQFGCPEDTICNGRPALSKTLVGPWLGEASAISKYIYTWVPGPFPLLARSWETVPANNGKTMGNDPLENTVPANNGKTLGNDSRKQCENNGKRSP